MGLYINSSLFQDIFSFLLYWGFALRALPLSRASSPFVLVTFQIGSPAFTWITQGP
jgi:hypothetical protein